MILDDHLEFDETMASLRGQERHQIVRRVSGGRQLHGAGPLFVPERVLRRLDLDARLAAVSIYLLTAVLWAALYMLVAVRFENSFAYASQIVLQEFDPVAIAQGLRMDDFYYYSVTTLTTAGLGDISPVTDPAQFLTALEALVGQLFLVVFVAHLVGLRIALRVAGRSPES